MPDKALEFSEYCSLSPQRRRYPRCQEVKRQCQSTTRVVAHDMGTGWTDGVVHLNSSRHTYQLLEDSFSVGLLAYGSRYGKLYLPTEYVPDPGDPFIGPINQPL